MHELIRAPIRASAFLAKEIFEVLRQPQLILTVVLGPFLILLLIGIGFRNEPRVFRTLLVVPQQAGLAGQIKDYITRVSPQFEVAGTTPDEAQARERLRRGEVDLVVVIPPEAEARIQHNQQAMLAIYHNEIDPFQASYVQFVGEVYVQALNRQVLMAVTEQGQSEASSVQEDISTARTAATAMREALERGDSAAARENQRSLTERLGRLDQTAGASAGLLAALVQAEDPAAGGVEVEAILASLAEARQGTQSLSDILEDCRRCEAQVQTAREVEADLENLQQLLDEFEGMDAGVLVSPFRVEAHSVTPVAPRVIDFFAPAVLALLLQHLAVTFAALSIIRERQLGTVELFRISPLSTTEALLGKYLSYWVFGGLLAAVLTGWMVYLMRVPMLGNWLQFSLVIAALLFASLGIGFVMSLIAQTDSQAVQYSMLVLLMSVFFSGLFISPHVLWEPMRVISWMLPVTYGLNLLQAIMLRGVSVTHSLPMLGGLLAIGLFLFVVAWTRMQRLMARQ